MPKVKFNKLIDSLSGRVGDLIFYEADGQNLSRAMPEITAERTEKQKANSGRFIAAQKYAATALTNPMLKAAYKAACRGHQNPRNLAIRDAMRAPVVESIKLDGYTGKPGQIVLVKATDDFRVVEVKVTVRGPTGELIEEGLAELSSDGNEWRYTTGTEVPSGQSVSVVAVAKDNPGNTAECQRWHYIPAPAV
jgi:Na+-translocating ferredoxin:NAD+ oxidoreductase RnfG subunit